MLMLLRLLGYPVSGRAAGLAKSVKLLWEPWAAFDGHFPDGLATSSDDGSERRPSTPKQKG